MESRTIDPVIVAVSLLNLFMNLPLGHYSLYFDANIDDNVVVVAVVVGNTIHNK